MRLLPQVGEENVLQVLREVKQFQDLNEDYRQLFKNVQVLVKHDEQLFDLVSTHQISSVSRRLDEDAEKVLAISQVLRGLKHLQDVNQDCKQLLKNAQNVVKHDEQLFDLVCLNAAPNTFCVSTISEGSHETALAPAHGGESKEKILVGSDSGSDIAESKPPKSQAGTNHSNAGPSHAQSGSSEKSEFGGHESSSADLKMCPAQQAELQESGMKHHEQSDITLLAALPLEPLADFGQAVGAASSSNQPRPFNGPRRKTRRGRPSQNRQRDRMSAPDTHKSWVTGGTNNSWD
jgi:hypothetical protein